MSGPCPLLSCEREKYLAAQELVAWFLRDQVRRLLLEPLGSILVELGDPLRFGGQVDRAARVPAFVRRAFALEPLRHIGKERLQPDWERFDVPERPLIIGVGRMSGIIDQQHYASIRVVLERSG